MVISTSNLVDIIAVRVDACGGIWEPTILSSRTTLWTMQTQRKTFRLGRRLAKQGPRPLSSNQGRVEKSVT